VEQESPAVTGAHANSAPLPIRRRRWLYLIALPLLAGIFVWSLNYLLIQRVVSLALDSDSRNAGYSIAAHYRSYVEPSTLVLDLRDVSSATPLDLFRGLFQSAAALAAAGRRFDRVILARGGMPVFMMSGEDFGRLGAEFAAGQNPVFLIRTLPEKFRKPTGESAFAHWEGGVLGVLGKQMEDATEAGRRWAGAR
jgi:hypothetical protein